MYIGHILTLLLYTIAIILLIRQLVRLYSNDKVLHINSVWTLYIGVWSALSVCLTFIVLQVQDDMNTLIGLTTYSLWLAFDTFLGVFMICFSVFLDAVRCKLILLDTLERTSHKDMPVIVCDDLKELRTSLDSIKKMPLQ